MLINIIHHVQTKNKASGNSNTLLWVVLISLLLGASFYMNKKCLKCNLIKPISCFGVNKSTKDKLHYYCRECSTLYALNWHHRTYKKKTYSIPEIDGEIWKSILGYDGLYMISSFGRVKSLKGRGGNREMLLRQYKNHNGYPCVRLFDGKKHKGYFIHRLVIIAFVSLSPSQEVDHINGIKHDNRLLNLRICSRSENMSFNNHKRKSIKSSKYVGVCWDKKSKKWKAEIQKNKIRVNLGRFEKEDQAFLAYKNLFNA